MSEYAFEYMQVHYTEKSSYRTNYRRLDADIFIASRS